MADDCGECAFEIVSSFVGLFKQLVPLRREFDITAPSISRIGLTLDGSFHFHLFYLPCYCCRIDPETTRQIHDTDVALT